MLIAMQTIEAKPSEVVAHTNQESARDFEYPQREAAFSTGYLCAVMIRKSFAGDIAVPPEVLAKWHREAEREPKLRDVLARVVE